MRRVIITGATGMLGIALMERLISQHYEIFAIVNPKSTRLDAIPKHPNIHLMKCDISKLIELKESLSGSFDTFYHFAWSGTHVSTRNDLNIQLSNVRFTLDAVELANAIGCKCFLGAGSQAEYGRVENTKLSPETATFPENGYGASKLCAGQLSRMKCKEYGIKHIWVRIFSTYGPHDGAKTMISTLITQLLNHEKPSCTGGEQMWDYLYCKDAAKAFQLAAEKGGNNSIYCVGSGMAHTLREYIKTVRDCINPFASVGFGEIPYYDNQVMYLCADITNLQKDTGFFPEYTFEEGIQETIAWYKKADLKNEEN